MIFGRAGPWHNKRQRNLCRAGFHVDHAKAQKLAENWLETYTLDSVAYPEHRLLVRIANRFPEARFKSGDTGRITGLKRQLWARGNFNLKAAMAGFAALDSFGIPWVLCGAAQWFAQPDAVAREAADFIEFTVPDKARSAALHVLVQNGWRQDWTSPEADAGPVYSTLSKGQATLRLSKAGALFAYAPDRAETIWPDLVAQDHALGRLYVPDQGDALTMAVGKAHPAYKQDDQWIFDLFNLGPDPLSLLDQTGIDSRIGRRLMTFLRSGFYR